LLLVTGLIWERWASSVHDHREGAASRETKQMSFEL
jgi:hypothetical protein